MTLFKCLTILLLFILGCLELSGSAWAGFPASMNCGSAKMGDERYSNEVSIGYIAGVMTGHGLQNWVGYWYVARGAYEDFLDSDRPLAVRPEPANAGNSPFIVSPDRSIRLSWSDGRRNLPVQYRVFWSNTSPSELRLLDTTGDRFRVLRDLNYLQDYYWQIEAFDTYGRAMKSAVFSFSLAPGVGRLYCAPNPFRAGSEPTTFMFTMPGPGSAKLSFYYLPHLDLVFSTALNDLQPGVNAFGYNGADNSGRTLYNGVYMAIIQMKGVNGDDYDTQKFKFLVVK